MGKIKQIVASFNGVTENVYPVTLAESVMYYDAEEGSLKTLKDYIDNIVLPSGDYLPLPESSTETLTGLIGISGEGDNIKTHTITQIPEEFLPSYVDDVIEVNGIDILSEGEFGKIYVDTSTNWCYRWSGSKFIKISSDGEVINDAGSSSNPVYILNNEALACDIQIGGRNYCQESKGFTGAQSYQDGYLGHVYWRAVNTTNFAVQYITTSPLTKGTQYTLSAYVRSDATSGLSFRLSLRGLKSGNSNMYNIMTYPNNVTSDWQRVTVSGEVPTDGAEYFQFFFKIDNLGNGTYVDWCMPQVELGNQPTDWTPAPEDFDSKLNTTKTEIIDGNVASATKLQTARKLWGNNFDGTGDVNGQITIKQNYTQTFASDNGQLRILNTGYYANTSNPQYALGLGVHQNGYGEIQAGQPGIGTLPLFLQKNGGNVTIGGTSDTGYKLDVQGSMHCAGEVELNILDAKCLGTDSEGILIETGNATPSSAGLMSAADKTKLDGIAKEANKYTLPTASSTLGGVKTTSTITSTSGLTACPIISGVVYYKDTNTTYSNFVKSGSGAKAGLVPAPSTTAGTTKYLREDGTWAVPPDTNTDTMVSQSPVASTASDANVNLPLLASMSYTTTAKTGTSKFSSAVYLNPKSQSVTAVAFYQTSDKNLKENISDLNIDIDKILSIPTISFDYKESKSHHIGTIAQEVEKVCPEIVQTDNAGIKSVDYAKLSVLALKALKDTKAELDGLKSNHDALKNDVEQIKALLKI